MSCCHCSNRIEDPADFFFDVGRTFLDFRGLLALRRSPQVPRADGIVPKDLNGGRHSTDLVGTSLNVEVADE